MISITLVIFKRDKNSILLLALCGNLILMFSGIIIYTAKIGGLSDSQEIFLFLSPKIKNSIQYMVITLDKLGYLIAVGRYLFPTFLLLISINYSMNLFAKGRTKWIWATLIFPIVSLVIYYPKVFYAIMKGRFQLQRVLMTVVLIWIFVYVALSIGLLIKEYRNITMAYFSHKFRYIILSHISLALLYGIYSIQDPIQIYQLYGAEYLWVSGMSYANPSLSFLGWCVLSIATITFVVLGFYNLFNYTKINFNADQEDIKLQRKFDTISKGASVFVHSIKNQLLSARVINKKINKVFSQENPDLEELKKYTDMFNQMNENMLEHIEELYRSIKFHSILLSPIPLEVILKMSIDKFNQKYPDYHVKLSLACNEYVLADKVHLSEAVYNLIINAQEAVIAAGREGDSRIEMSIVKERLYTVIKISDNGIGISKNVRKKIFDPFFTSKNTNYNWGMGLYYVRKIIKNHFGILRLESIPGEGTIFYVLLPRYDEPKKEL